MSTLPLRIRKLSGVVSTDDIIPGRYKHMFTDPGELAKHVFENLLPGYAATLAPGDALLCDSTFGIGSSREQAVSSLMAAGVKAVIAPRFGRIFFRNSWNLGLVAIELDDLPVGEMDTILLHLAHGRFTGGFGETRFQPPPPRMLEMVENGGLLSLIRRRLVLRPAAANP